ncbi:DUF6348 family protein [Nonomuraea gerenzanensis]|uniref:Uncharacterized protein n=1 Tax=Nonomuraea gerenzanensis TaxID=93944 RepID=A0A1M4EI15_9ACTN|nr:DUF6348 family protein [Nonomuraea gerenzanensis]UBU10160.1 DUF6348 family protein [Nonomuraea gerenzanensis]SBO98535.1 hypothetical protein BN4615_P8051 [Nonomuraea gerenzanensis]
MDGVRPADEVVLGRVAEQLSAATGQHWEVRDGLAEGPGTLAVRLGADHTGSPAHLDLDFVLNLDTTISDCVTGYGATVEEAVDRAIQMWLGTTGGALLELLVQDGSHAAHFAPGDPDGFPGWHAIHGGIVGWGTGDEHDAVQRWAVQHVLLPHLAPALKGTLEREHLVGVKAFFGGGAGTQTAEVRVNGACHEAGSRALAQLDWPRPAGGVSYARTFVLLVHQE